jgi:hypothetical protein
MTRSDDQQRAYDHYRWAQRYTKYGEHEKAQAHMQRALHYGKSMGFGTGGTGPDGPDRTGSAGSARHSGSAEGPEEPKRQRTSGDDSSSRTGSSTGVPSGKTDIVFILGPLNASAVEKIKKSIQDSKDAGNKVEVYMQAFTEQGKVFTAPNLLPMNFNQYSSDDPNVLVDIINDNKDEDNVEFYIFPTQTTKNDHFSKNSALPAFKSKIAEKHADIDKLILTSIVTWLKKDEDLEKGGHYDLKGMDYYALQAYAQNPAIIKTLPGPQPIFDPFCAVCAAHKNVAETSTGNMFGNVLSDVGGSGRIVAQKVHVKPDTELTDEEKRTLPIKESPIKRPRFRHTEERSNCFVVTWGSDEQVEASVLTDAAGKDGRAYIEELWASFSGSLREARRIVNRILIVQDYYDYDNKMSVWYILNAFYANVIDLYSVTRPVAEKEVMRTMREHRGAFDFAGGYAEAIKTSALSPDSQKSWGSIYPVAGPVFTERNFNAGDVTIPKGTPTQPTTQRYEPVIFEGEELTFKRFKEALHMTPARIAESDAESGHIAYTWSKFVAHMLEYNKVGNPDARLYVTNGGYTNRHGLNPALHTIIEDWYKDNWFPVDRRMPVDILKKRQKA